MNKWINLVWDHSPSDGSRLLVLLDLADRANDRGECWPSVSEVARRTRLSERQVKRVLRLLDEDGEIQMPSGPRSSDNPFRVTPVTPGHPVTVSPATPLGCHGRHPGGVMGDTPQGTPTRARVEPSVEPSVEPKEEPKDFEVVWDYFFELFPTKRKRAIDATSKRLIENAVALVGVEGAKRALLGLSRSPFHAGQNEQRKTYHELRYALKGKQREGESDADRIEKAIAWAGIHAPEAKPVDEAKVQRWLDEVRYTMSLPHRPERDRAARAYKALIEAGFNVIRLDSAPWVRVER